MRFLCALAVVIMLPACPSPTMSDDSGTTETPIVTSVLPNRGAITGGTAVTINGDHFVDGAAVAFGGVTAAVSFVNERKLAATSPVGSTLGVVAVTVTNPGGKASTLEGAFTYAPATTGKNVAEAVLLNMDSTASTSAAAVTSIITAHVDAPSSTPGAGQGLGVKAQVGYSTMVSAPPMASDFTWVDATYLGDADGTNAGDLARDSYSGTVMLAGPSVGAQVAYFVTARFSADEGMTWTLADRDGAANGVSPMQLAKVTVTRASIDWCKLGGQVVEAPPMITLKGPAPGPVVFGQVYKMGVTNAPGAGPKIKGALGYGAPGSEPSTWTWVDATFNADTGNGSNDEFMATLPNPGLGKYTFAFRFNSDNGPWSYCDANGLALNGYTEDQAGTLTVREAQGVDSCKLQFPAMLTTAEGRPSEPIFGRALVLGVTEAPGAGASVEGQVGWGPAEDPTNSSWVWSSSAAFNIDSADGDEFRASLVGPAPGSYFFAYRFRVGTSAWTYCDRDGSTNGVQPTQLGALTSVPFDVQNCALEMGGATQTVLPGATSQPYAAVITVPTLTTDAGQGTPLPVDVGFGPVGSDPSTWTNWTAATYADDQGVADRYRGTLTAPTMTGVYAVAFRTRVGPHPYAYCDLDGSNNGFQQAGRLTVTTAAISGCRLSQVSTSSVASGSALTATARVIIPGVTPLTGAAPSLQVQVGLGPVGDNASTSQLWGWQTAGFVADVAGADEFSLTTWPAYTGGRAVSARASLDGASWVYCDLNGSDLGGYEVNQQYSVTVTPHTEFDFCNTQAPRSINAGGTVYGQIYELGLTPNATTPFIAQLGVGAETEDPGLSWQWAPAVFNVTAGNNNEYRAALPNTGVAGKRYAFRYSLDGGVWCYGDFDGSNNGFSGGTNVGVVNP